MLKDYFRLKENGTSLRTEALAAVPASLKSAIAVGIGLLVTLIGMEWAGLVRLDPNTFVTLGNLGSKPALVALLGLPAIVILIARRVKGAILFGMLIAAVAGVALSTCSLRATRYMGSIEFDNDRGIELT